jgi:ABC-type lipoprotein release transport system permease subunit
MAIPLIYNVRNVIQRPVSTVTTAVGIALTIAILVAALALAEGFHHALVSTGSPANAHVLRKGADSEISSGIARDATDILRGLPDVAAGPDGRPMFSAEMVVVNNMRRLGQPGSSNVTLRGVDPATIGVHAVPVITEGRMFTPGTDEVVVGQTISGRFESCRVGDHLTFAKRAFTVVGHFTTHGSSFESEIWGDANVLMPIMHRDAYQVVVFRMKDPARFDAVKKLAEGDPRLGVQVDREDHFYAEQSATLTAVLRTVGVFITVIMAVGALFGAANTMFAAVSGRTREIATLLVLGFSPWAVMTSFITESTLIALAGGVLGCLIALPINGITTGTTNFQSFSEVAFRFRVTPPLMITALVFSALLGAAGGFVPALQASRQSLAAGLRRT